MLFQNAPAPFSKYLILSYLLYLSYPWQFKEYSSAGMKKNYILYSKKLLSERVEVRLLMKIESITLSELTDTEKDCCL